MEIAASHAQPIARGDRSARAQSLLRTARLRVLADWSSLFNGV